MQKGQDLVWQVEAVRLHVPRTFFEIGEHIDEYDPDGTVEREMLAGGDMIGDHTWSHPDLVGVAAAQQRRQISPAAAAIRKATGAFEPCLFRGSVLAHAQDGGIIEEHFGDGPRYETLDALPMEVARLRKRRYQLVTITHMLGYRLVYR